MLLWKVMVVWLWRVYYTTLKIICKDKKWKYLAKKCDLSGISSMMNIPTPFSRFGSVTLGEKRLSIVF